MKNYSSYNILDNVSIFFNGENEIRFRKGIWNYEEATLTLDTLSDNLKEAFLSVVESLAGKGEVELSYIHKNHSLLIDELSVLRNVVDTLVEQRYLEPKYSETSETFVKELIGGTISEILVGEKIHVQPVLFISDNERLKEYANMIAEDLSMPLTIMNDSDILRIQNANITDKIEAMETVSEETELGRLLYPFSCVVVSFERPRLALLRNLNRLLLKTSTPLILSILDGPFLNMTTVKGGETACYECFENRVISRNESLAVYENFVKQTGGVDVKREATYITPILQTFTSLALFEAFLLATVNRSKFVGRVLNIYIPLIEIQVQDLLRIAFCPACGHISKAKYDEMYTTSKQVVGQLVDSVILSKDEDGAKMGGNI